MTVAATVASRAAREGEITATLAVLGVRAQEPAFVTAARTSQLQRTRVITVLR